MPRYFPLQQLSADFHVTPRRLKRAIRDFRIPVLRLGRSISFDAVALTQLEEALRQCPDPPVSASNPASTRPPARATALRYQGRSPGSAYAAALKATTPSSPAKRRDASKSRFSEPPGECRGVRPFAEAALSYLDAASRSEHTKDYVRSILMALGDIKLGQVDQDAAIRLRRIMLPTSAAPSTYVREVVTLLRAILRHAAARG
jgi:hypothetical protein